MKPLTNQLKLNDMATIYDTRECDTLNAISDMLDKVWNEKTGCDCLVWVDERLDKDTIALGWQIVNDEWVTKEYVATVCIHIFKEFEWVNTIVTHWGDTTREQYNLAMAMTNGNYPTQYEIIEPD